MKFLFIKSASLSSLFKIVLTSISVILEVVTFITEIRSKSFPKCFIIAYDFCIQLSTLLFFLKGHHLLLFERTTCFVISVFTAFACNSESFAIAFLVVFFSSSTSLPYLDRLFFYFFRLLGACDQYRTYYHDMQCVAKSRDKQ